MAAPTLRTAGSWVAANAATQTVTLPTHQTGDMLIVRVGAKHANFPPTITCDTANWNKLGQKDDNGGASVNGGGGVCVAVFWKIATSGSETNPVIRFHASTAATPSVAVAMAYQKASGDWENPAGDGGDVASVANYTATMQSHVAAATDDLLDMFAVLNDNGTMTVPTVTQAGLTLDAVTESPAAAISSATSNDISADGAYRTATAGTSSAAAAVSGTSSVANSGVAWVTRLRISSGVTGTGAIAVDEATLAASGAEDIPGSGAPAIDEATLSASGTVANPVTGTGAPAIDEATLAASGAEVFTGTGAVAVDEAALAAAGSEVFTGTSAVSVDEAGLAGTGEQVDSGVTGTGALAVDEAALAASGAEVFTGSAAVAVDEAALAASGAEVFTGSGDLLVDEAAFAAAGVTWVAVTGSGELTAEEALLALAGVVIVPVTGTGALAVQEAVLAAIGDLPLPIAGNPLEPARIWVLRRRSGLRRVG